MNSVQCDVEQNQGVFDTENPLKCLWNLLAEEHGIKLSPAVQIPMIKGNSNHMANSPVWPHPERTIQDRSVQEK